MIKYLGIFWGVYHILNKGGILYAYLSDKEIIITYDKECPFRIISLSIELERFQLDNNTTEVSYQVFEVDLFADTDELTIIIAKEFALQILNSRKDLFEVFKRNYVK